MLNKKLFKSLIPFLSLLLIINILGPAVPTVRFMAGKAQPVLAQMAAGDPDQIVSVIVQKTDGAAEVEEQVLKLGGKVTKDLKIINAFSAEMTAGAAMQLAHTDWVRWVSLDAPVQQSVASTKFTTWATTNGTVVTNGFKNYANILSPVGKNGTFGYGSRVKGAFGGFMPEFSPGAAITKVELRLRLYTPKALASTEVIKVTPYVGGKASGLATIPASAVNAYLGTAGVSILTFDVTGLGGRRMEYSPILSGERCHGGSGGQRRFQVRQSGYAFDRRGQLQFI